MKRQRSKTYVTTLVNDEEGRKQWDVLRKRLSPTHNLKRFGRGKNRLERVIAFYMERDNLTREEVLAKYKPWFQSFKIRVAQHFPLPICDSFDVYAYPKPRIPHNM